MEKKYLIKTRIGNFVHTNYGKGKLNKNKLKELNCKTLDGKDVVLFNTNDLISNSEFISMK